jgi:hypothetical protein
VKQVVVLLPPPKNKKGVVSDKGVAMFFRRGDVDNQLTRPIRFTLPSPPPSIPSLKAGATAHFIDRLTSSELFQFDLQPGQDASVFLILAPISNGSSTGTGTTGP